MIAVPVIGFMLVALLAIAFVAVPLLRAKDMKRTGLIAAGLALFVLAIGSTAYWMVGRPYLAQREAQGTDALSVNEPNTLIPLLIQRVRQYPNDSRAWRFLGQAYMAARDPVNAAKALARAITLEGKGDPELTTAYGEALVMANGGKVPAEAEAAFHRRVAGRSFERAGALLSGRCASGQGRQCRRGADVAEPAGRHLARHAALPRCW